ncbi:MAG: PBP1A family penicillin-binding protein [Leptospiraceae bacterium]|nr:PBP1A family penicillin-binding protein [Leptospiraceae bacterium]
MNPGQKRLLGWTEKGILIGFAAIALVGGLIYGLILASVDSREQIALLASYRPSTPTRLYDRNGQVFAELYRHKQELVRLEDIPPHVVQAFLAVEDDNFFNHFGIDFMGIFRAAVKNIMAGRIVQGGSTLTQQLAKQIYLNAEGQRSRNFTQKIRETVLAVQMEEELTKDEILEVFFNVIYLGHGCKGIACASRLYFDKRVQELTLAEGALLARLPKSPVEYSPFKYPEAAREQHLFVLNRMAETGFLKSEEVEPIHRRFWAAYWPKIVVQSPSRSIWAQKLDMAPYFTDYVRQVLEANPAVGADALYSNGLKVYTTLDLTQQRIADDEMTRAIRNANRIGQNYVKTGGRGGVDTSLFGLYRSLGLILPVGGPIVKALDDRGVFRREAEDELDGIQILSYLTPANNEAAAFEEFRQDTTAYVTNLEVQGAFIAIEPSTGFITAMIGGSEFSPSNQFNRAVRARRQPGSAFKIFVYGGAIESRSMSSTTAINDAPFFTIAPDGSSWSPGNYEQGFMGLVPAKRALAYSLNTCSVQVYFRVGPEPIIDLASRLMKISNRNRFNPDPALALGASEITPMELATAVSIIANQGKDVMPFAVRYVTDQSGNIVYNQEEQIRRIQALKTQNGSIQIIEPGLAFILRDMMSEVANAGTARHGLRSWNEGGYQGDLACKTGTTSNWSDAWITGFNPEYATALWFGFDKSSVTLGPGQAGGSIAAPVMGSFYRRLYRSEGRSEPRFSDLNNPPPDVLTSGCGGYAMAETTIDGVTLRPATDGTCGGERIYDARRLLMEELGIDPEEIGQDPNSRIRFKNQ